MRPNRFILYRHKGIQIIDLGSLIKTVQSFSKSDKNWPSYCILKKVSAMTSDQ